MNRLLLLLLTLAIFTQEAEAQLFKKLKKAVGDKIERKVEDRLVDELSEELARRAVKPIDNAFDDMFRNSYKEQYGKEYDDSEYEGDPEKQAEMMNALLGSMYGNVELPDSYDFKYKVVIDVHDFGEKKSNEMTMLIDPDGGGFGMEQKENGEDQIMIFDTKKDQVIIFNNKEKTAMAIPNVMKMAGTFGRKAMEDEMEKNMKKFEKINKTKDIIGYKSQGYKYESDEDKGEFFVTTNLPFDWTDSFGGLVEQISPNFYKEHPEYKIAGMLMYAKTKRKSDGKESKWEVKKIDDNGLHLKCSDYKLANMMGE